MFPPCLRVLATLLNRRGASQAITSVILIMAAMSASVVAFFYAQLNLSTQSKQTEFENAKASMESIAQIIEDLSYSKGAAAYTSISGGLTLTQGTESITVTVDDGINDVETWNLGRINLIRFRGGEGVSGSYFNVLRGDMSITDKDVFLNRYLIISPSNPGPLGVVYQEWDKAAWINVDFGRIKVVPSGAVPYTENGLDWYNINSVQIIYLNITRNITGGEPHGSDVFDIYVRVKDVKTYLPRAFQSSIVEISVNRGPEDDPSRYNNAYTIEGTGTNVLYTLVYLTVVEVEVSVR